MSSTAPPENTCWSRRAADSSAYTRTPPLMVSNVSRSHGSGSSSRTPRAWISRRCRERTRAATRVSGGLQRLNVHKSYTERMRDCARNVHKADSRRRAMGVLKRKEEPSETITLRVPASVKAEIDRLRERTNEAGFDLNATICETI